MWRWVSAASAIVAVLMLGVGGYWLYAHHTSASVATTYKTVAENDTYVRFDMEAYDSIQSNFWNSLTQDQLSELFRLSLAKAAGKDETLATTTREGVADMLLAAFNTATSTDAKKQLALNTLVVALYNLAPAGRAQLMSQKQEKALRQEVSNVNPSKNLYDDLGIQKGASVADVNTAYQKVKQELQYATSTEDKQKAQEADYAHKVLADSNTKNLYDQAQVEPSVFGTVIGHTLYFNLTQITPTTLQEFGLAVDSASTTPGLDSMILDVRGNIGGAFDFLPAFLGLFIGPNQYAFDLYRHGDFMAQRTTTSKFDELARFKDIAILTDGMTQSTAEVTTAAFKRYKLAHVVGQKTRGWGTVENTYPIQTQIDPSESYALYLVNSITLDDANQPIEGRGVLPDVDTTDPNWKSELNQYFTSTSLIAALKAHATEPPIK